MRNAMPCNPMDAKKPNENHKQKSQLDIKPKNRAVI